MSADSWLSPAVLARLKGQASHRQGSRHSDNILEPVEDPDDVIDPDDSGPRLLITLKESPGGESYALPAAQAAGREQITGRYPDTLDHSKAPQSPSCRVSEKTAAAGAPVPPDLLDPAVLRRMPAKVAAFMMYEPPDPPPRRAETAGQREEREFFEGLGVVWADHR